MRKKDGNPSEKNQKRSASRSMVRKVPDRDCFHDRQDQIHEPQSPIFQTVGRTRFLETDGRMARAQTSRSLKAARILIPRNRRLVSWAAANESSEVDLQDQAALPEAERGVRRPESQ